MLFVLTLDLWNKQDFSKKVHTYETEIAEENNRATSFAENGLFS